LRSGKKQETHHFGGIKMIGLLGSSGWIGLNVKKALDDASIAHECVERTDINSKNVGNISKYRQIINCAGYFNSIIYDPKPIDGKEAHANIALLNDLIYFHPKSEIISFFSNQAYMDDMNDEDSGTHQHRSVYSSSWNNRIFCLERNNNTRIALGAVFDDTLTDKNILYQFLHQEELPSKLSSFCSMKDLCSNLINYVSVDSRDIKSKKFHFSSSDLICGEDLKQMFYNNFEIREKTLVNMSIGGSLLTEKTKQAFLDMGAKFEFGSAKKQIKECLLSMKEKMYDN